MIKASKFYKNLPRLETPRQILRSVTMDDLGDIYAYASDEEVCRFLRWGPHKTLEETEISLIITVSSPAGKSLQV